LGSARSPLTPFPPEDFVFVDGRTYAIAVIGSAQFLTKQ
jgi:hypothetical protein